MAPDKQSPVTPKSAESPSAPKLEPTEPPYIIYRSKEELKLIKSIEDGQVCKSDIVLVKCEDKNNRVEGACGSEDGQLIAWCDNNVIRCMKVDSSREIIFDQPNTCRSNCVSFSPKATKLVTYSTMNGGDNLHFWDIPTQTHLASMPFLKASQWKPVFSMNEDICLQHVNTELLIHSGGKFDKPKHITHIKVNDFSLSTASFHNPSYQHIYEKRIKNKTHYIAIYTAGTKGQPSIVKIFKYPNLTDCITNKSFFKADSVSFSWSPSGNSLLLVCQSDFDSTGKSYYGEQTLNFMSVKGESYFVKLPKEGPISHIEWLPSCEKDMFVCVYGQVPAKVTLFSNKCEPIFHFDDNGVFNTARFNPFGNLLAVYGIGNLAGQLCIWNFEKKKLITTLKMPETTNLQWSPDGQHILTCTTTPRLRVGNGFRLWHYSGSLIFEQICNQPSGQGLELYDIFWQQKPSKYRRPKIDSKPSQLPDLMTQSNLSKFQSSAAKYVPPSMRNKLPSVSSMATTSPSKVTTPTGKGSKMGLKPVKGVDNSHIVGLESLTISRKKGGTKKPQKTQ